VVSADRHTGRLDAIWIKRAHRGKMDEVTEATAVAGQGIAGNVDRSRRRQVTIIEREVWESIMRQLDANVSPSSRRANLMVSGVRLQDSRGRTLRVGSVRLAIGGETTPCERMDEALPGLREAMRPNWGGGVFAQVLDDGMIAVGDSVIWEEHEAPSPHPNP
jgi:MOSC domain-containing protein YiiM